MKFAICFVSFFATISFVSAEKAPGRLRIVTEPTGASVYVNGELAGTGPLDLELNGRPLHLRISAPGWHDLEMPVFASGNAEVVARLTLHGTSPEPEPGTPMEAHWGSMFRSMIVPGWGQYARGNSSAYWFATSTLLTGSFYMLARARAIDARRNLAHAYQIGDAYELGLTTQPGRQVFAPAALMAFNVHAQEQSYSQCGVTSAAHIAVGTVHACRMVKQTTQVRNNAALLVAVLYTWNILDALLSRSGTEVSIGGVDAGSFGISATARF